MAKFTGKPSPWAFHGAKVQWGVRIAGRRRDEVEVGDEVEVITKNGRRWTGKIAVVGDDEGILQDEAIIAGDVLVLLEADAETSDGRVA